MTRKLRVAIRVLCTLSVLLLSACTRTPPEQAVRQQVELLQHAIEARDAAAVEAVLATDFIGNDGMDKRQVRRMATAMFLRYRNTGISIGPLQLRMQGESRATVDFTAVATGGDGALPENGQIWNVKTGWRLDGDDWRLVSAEWQSKL